MLNLLFLRGFFFLCGVAFAFQVTSPVVSDAEKQELLLLYQAFLITDSAMSEEVKKDISLLTTMLGISDEVLQGA